MLLQIKSRPKNRTGVLRDGGAPRQIARGAITRGVCRSWFPLSSARELPIDGGGEGKFTKKLRLEAECRTQAMDFRMKLARIRVVPPPDQRLRSLVQGAEHAEAFAGKMLAKAGPSVEKLHSLRTRIATLAVAVLAIWLFIHATFGANGMVVYRAKRAEYQALQKDIVRVQKENSDYNEQVKQLKSDPKRIEREAREQFHYARPGEVIYVSPERPAPQPPANRTASK